LLFANAGHDADTHDGFISFIRSDLDGWLDAGREPCVEGLGTRLAVGALVEARVNAAQRRAALDLGPSARLPVKAASLKADASL
jgi:hypothetical protein